MSTPKKGFYCTELPVLFPLNFVDIFKYNAELAANLTPNLFSQKCFICQGIIGATDNSKVNAAPLLLDNLCFFDVLGVFEDVIKA